MPQPNNQQLEQQVQVKEKLDVTTKVVLGTGIFCALVFLINFVLLFNVGVAGINQAFLSESIKKVKVINQLDEDREVGVQLSLNWELNNLQTYSPSQQDVNLLAFDLINNSTSSVTLTELRLLPFVDGLGVPSTSTLRFSPGRSNLDGGVAANQIIENLDLFQYINGYYYQLNASSTQIIPSQGYYVTFNDLAVTLEPSGTSTTLVLMGDVTSEAPYGWYPDAISFDMKNWRTDVFIYNQNNQRVKAGPNLFNGGQRPRVYHQVATSTLP